MANGLLIADIGGYGGFEWHTDVPDNLGLMLAGCIALKTSIIQKDCKQNSL
jgi:hypothetical protein